MAEGKCNKAPKKGCKAYRAEGRREINKALRIARHIRKFPADVSARHCAERLSAETARIAKMLRPLLERVA